MAMLLNIFRNHYLFPMPLALCLSLAGCGGSGEGGAAVTGAADDRPQPPGLG